MKIKRPNRRAFAEVGGIWSRSNIGADMIMPRASWSGCTLWPPLRGLSRMSAIEVGESIGTLGPVIRLVQNDPLRIDVPVPMAQAGELAVGQNVWVTFPGTTADALAERSHHQHLGRCGRRERYPAGSNRSAQPSEASGRRTCCRQLLSRNRKQRARAVEDDE